MEANLYSSAETVDLSIITPNYGHGSKPLRTRKEGKDLIVVFNGKDSGITPDEFAPKLIGKNRKGEVIFGYASLPHVDYRPSLVSARKPVYVKEEGRLDIRVENFGLSTSAPVELEIWLDGASIGKQTVPSIAPYSSVTVSHTIDNLQTTDNSVWRVMLCDTNGKTLENVSF